MADKGVKVLILSYHFPPLNVIASYRAKAYADYFSSFGIYPIVVTHNWGRSDVNIVEITENDHVKVIKLPISSTQDRLRSIVFKLPFIRKSAISLSWLMGYLDDAPGQRSSYLSYKRYLHNYLKNNHVDLILSIYSPHHHLRLTHWLHRKFQIPYVFDFRDLWNNRVMMPNYSPGFVEKFKNLCSEYYWKKWLKNALFFVSISDLWVEEIERLTQCKGYKIMHGFDESILENAEKSVDKENEFIVLYAGSASVYQDIEGLGSIFKRFIDFVRAKDVKVIFLGSKRNDGSFINPEEIIKQHLSSDQFEITSRVPRATVLDYYRRASILLMPTYKDLNGTYSGKLFEYLGAGKNILAYPSDHGVIEALLQETNAGFSFNNPEDAISFLTDKYNEWQKSGQCRFEGNFEIIKTYSRKNQVKAMAQLIYRSLPQQTRYLDKYL